MTAGDAEPSIRPELPADQLEVREVHTLAFGGGDGGGDKVPALVDALRVAAARLPPISLVATVGGRVVAHVLLSACRLDAPRRLVDVLSLSPLGVHPEHQRNGIGTRLSAYEPWMTGTFVYSETFWALDAVGLRPVDGAVQDG